MVQTRSSAPIPLSPGITQAKAGWKTVPSWGLAVTKLLSWQSPRSAEERSEVVLLYARWQAGLEYLESSATQTSYSRCPGVRLGFFP